MRERSPHARWLYFGLVLLLAVVAVVSFRRAVARKYDFHHFYLDAAYVWKHGELNPDLGNEDRSTRRQLPFYLPVVALLLSPLTVGGVMPAAALWTIGHLVALAYALRVLSGWQTAAPSRGPPGAALALACAVALPAVLEVARFNQLSFYILALVLGGLAALERDKPWRAGVLLGLATVVKLLPAAFAVWLALKRKWIALGAWGATVLVVALLPSLAVFGPRKTADYHRQWWLHNVHGSAARGMTDPSLREHFIDYRNQSIPAVLARLLWPEHRYPVLFQPVAVGAQAARAIAWCVTAVLVGGLLWATRRRLPGDDGFGWRAEAATYALAMLIFAPLLRQYYLIWALPGLVLLARIAIDPIGGRRQRLGQVGLALWLAGMLAWLAPTARAYGAHLLMLILLGIVLLSAARSRPAAAEGNGRRRSSARLTRESRATTSER